MKDLLTTKEIAEVCKVTTKTIYRWKDAGLPHVRLGASIRFKEDEVMEWLLKKGEEKNV